MNTKSIFTIQSDTEFEVKSLKIFHFQVQHNPIYRQYCNLVCKEPNKIKHIEEIPFLPIQFFKSHNIKSFEGKAEAIFLSSGTTGMTQSKHFVRNTKLYEQSFIKGFEQFYGNINDYTILALLPSYLERKGSSLIYMVDKFIELSNSKDSNFYLYEHQKLFEKLKELTLKGKKTLLIGVSFALLDFADNYGGKLNLKNTIIMETGGMKGRRKELLRTELHQILRKAFGVEHIHSEYGMTELLSQAYSQQNEIFKSPNWMRILIRDNYDPFSYVSKGKTGGINVIDLANVYTCSFIETMDLGKLHSKNEFEILGRFDNSDIRGCNLMVN